MQRSTKKVLSILMALCMLISLFPAQVIAFAEDALTSISVSDENENVSNAAPDTFYGEWRYKVNLIRNKTEYFYDAESFFSTMASANKGTFLLYCNYTLTSNVTVPASVTFMLPFSSTDTVGKGNGTSTAADGDCIMQEAWNQESRFLFATLTIPAGKRITVDGDMLVGGIVGAPDRSSQGHTSGAYSQIINNGSLVINGTLDINGLIKGTGTTSINNGGKMKVPFLINDFDGGTNSVTLRDAGVFPFNQFAVNNIQTPCIFNYGCEIIGKGLIYFSSLSMYLDADATLIGPESGAVIMDPGAKILTQYDGTKYIDAQIGDTTLNDFGKISLTSYGNIRAGNICLSYQVYNFDSADFVLGVPYNFDLTIASGTFTVPYKYRFMPGCRCTIGKNATLNLSGELQVTDGWEQPVMSEKRYPTSAQLHDNGFSQSGNLIINGTFNILPGATFAGIIQSTDPAKAKINIADDVTLSGTFTSGAKSEKSGAGDSTVSYYLSARANFGSGLQELEAGKSYTVASGDSWILPSYTMSPRGVETTIEINETMYGIFNSPEELPSVVPVDESGSVVDEEEKVVYGIPAGVENIEEYVTSSSTEATVSVIKNGDIIATGDTIELIEDGAVIASYTVVIIGDTDCDGLCTGMDSVFVQCVVSGLLNSSNTDEAVLSAADCNHDGVINEDDILYAQSTGLCVGSYFNANGEIVNGEIIVPSEDPEND